MSINIREGNREDVPAMFELIKELALYENAPEQVTNTVEQMYMDGFGENPIFGTIVLEVDNKVVGLSLYYYRYSTWKGKRLYLEDLIVSETMRGKGLGEKLLEATIEQARKSGSTGMYILIFNNDEIFSNLHRYGWDFYGLFGN
jgi:N-acetylglutamate synthase-like GNAT family acetyltransferase